MGRIGSAMGDLLKAGALARRDILVGGMCCLGAVLGSSASVWSAPRPLPDGGLSALIPEHIGEWSLASTHGVVIAEGDDRARGPYDDLLTRIYQSMMSPPVTLLVAYIGSQRASVRLHRPEACYPAAGFTLVDREPVRLMLPGVHPVSAQMILARTPTRSEQLLYWTRVGAEFPTSNVAQLGAFVRANLSGSVPDAVLVRLSVPGSDRARAWAACQTFLSALIAGSSPEAARVLFGGTDRPDHAGPPPSGRKGPSR